MRSACCSCRFGMFGKFCKHQFAVSHFHNIWGQNFPAVTAKARYEIAYLALGDKVLPLDFYKPFQEENECSPTYPQGLQTLPFQPDSSTNEVEQPEDDDAKVTELRKEFLKEIEGVILNCKSKVPGNVNCEIVYLRQWRTYCHHTFQLDCLYEFLREQNTCPNCRITIIFSKIPGDCPP